MKALTQVNFQHPALPLAGVSLGGGITGFVVSAMPYLHFCSVVVSLVAGILAIRAALKK